MKIALISDTHWGARGDSGLFLDYFSKFFREIFFPTLTKEKIDHVIIAGDLVDRRKYINFLTASKMRQEFLEPLKGKQVYIIPGNHDCYFKTHNETNALNELVSGYGFNIVSKPTEIIIGNDKIMLLPWISPDGIEESKNALNDTQAKILIAHLQLLGFEMHSGSICEEGMNMKDFSKFDHVFTGHFHHKSTKGNIYYLGAPYQITWADYNDRRGFHIFDIDTKKLTYIENPFDMFFKIIYDDKNKELDELMNLDFKTYKNSYVKVINKNKTNPYWFDLFLEKLEKAGAIDVKVIEDFIDYDLESNQEIIGDCEDTLTILQKHVRQSSLVNDIHRLEAFLKELYNEAISTEADIT